MGTGLDPRCHCKITGLIQVSAAGSSEIPPVRQSGSSIFMICCVLPFRWMAHILHIITGLGVGGAETMLYDLLAASTPPFKHSVLSLRASGPIAKRIQELGVPVHTLDLKPSAPNPARIWSLRAFTRQIAPDLIAGWMYHGNLMASFAGAGLPNLPILWAIHASRSGNERWNWRTATVIRLCARISHRPHGIIYASHVAQKQHEGRGYCGANSLVLPNGFDCDHFAPDARARAEVRKELGIDDSKIVVGVVARFHPMKDHRGLLRAAALLARTHPLVRFVLIGRGVDEDFGLRSFVQTLGLENQVLLLGQRSDMPRLTAAFDIACCASAWGECFSKAIGEAMACAVPCVVTDLGDNPDLVGQTGICVPPRDPNALANGLGQLVDAGPAGRKALGVAARRRIEENFSLPAIVARYEEVYNRYLPSAFHNHVRETKSLDPALRA